MIAIKHPKTNNIFPFLEWNTLILFGLFLIESIYVTIDTANNPKKSKKTKNIKSFVFTKKCSNSVGNHQTYKRDNLIFSVFLYLKVS